MSETPTKVIIDASLPQGHPDKIQVVPLTAEELAQQESDALAYAERQAAEEAAAQAKAEAKASAESKLAALGLTAEEIAALTA
jgi:magnesium-transporting ATPase (P-type)